MVYGLWKTVTVSWFMVDCLWFMEGSVETKCTAISQSVGRSQGTALRKN